MYSNDFFIAIDLTFSKNNDRLLFSEVLSFYISKPDFVIVSYPNLVKKFKLNELSKMIVYFP